MNYEYFTQLEEGSLTKAENETEQAFMEKVLSAVFTEKSEQLRSRVNDMLDPQFVGCSAEEKSLSISFGVQEWMLNPNGTLHGGVLSTAVDMGMSVLARYVRKQRGAATVQLSINFIRPVNKEEEFIVTASADHSGRRSTVIRAEVVVKSTGKLAATASGVFM